MKHPDTVNNIVRDFAFPLLLAMVGLISLAAGLLVWLEVCNTRDHNREMSIYKEQHQCVLVKGMQRTYKCANDIMIID